MLSTVTVLERRFWMVLVGRRSIFAIYRLSSVTAISPPLGGRTLSRN
jgi:hypothetical protein